MYIYKTPTLKIIQDVFKCAIKVELKYLGKINFFLEMMGIYAYMMLKRQVITKEKVD